MNSEPRLLETAFLACLSELEENAVTWKKEDLIQVRMLMVKLNSASVRNQNEISIEVVNFDQCILESCRTHGGLEGKMQESCRKLSPIAKIEGKR